MLGWFWDLGLIILAALFYGTPFYCMECMVVFSLAVCALRCKGESDWYWWERMEPNWWGRQATTADGEKPVWTKWLLDWKAYEGSQRNLGSFWCGSGGDLNIFLFWTEKDLARKVGERGAGEWTNSFVGVRGERSGS
jgi:hypothetical protein